jgi:hypothetical protein
LFWFGFGLFFFLPPPSAVGFCPSFLSRFAGFISLVFSGLSACFGLTLGCFLFAAAFGGRFLPPFFVPLCGIYFFDF